MGIQINGNTNNINAGIGSLSIEDINELDIVGVATAANFKTGVSNLHNVGLTLSGGQIDVGSNIKLGNAGVITATSFSGSGANLTSLPAQATIANNADDRVITGGSGVNLNGEQRLTFNSSNILTATETGTGNGMGGIRAATANAGGNAGYGFMTNSANRFAVTTIGSAGAESLRVYDDNNNAERLRIDSSGHVLPGANNTYDLGTTSVRWRNLYAQELNVTKASGNLSAYFTATNGLGTLEVGGSTGAFIDLRMPSSDDFDLRIGTGGSGGYMNVPSGQAISITGNFNPAANNTYDLGATGTRWRNIYTNDLNLSNEGGANDVDNTWGDYTIQEGESNLFLINNRNGKKYKFNLTEVS